MTATDRPIDAFTVTWTCRWCAREAITEGRGLGPEDKDLPDGWLRVVGGHNLPGSGLPTVQYRTWTATETRQMLSLYFCHHACLAAWALAR